MQRKLRDWWPEDFTFPRPIGYDFHIYDGFRAQN